ncbi:MAG: metallophosphoesterase [Christensenellales bacterium]
MKIALIADLHGNMTAVEALEADLRARGIDRIWCLGDLVGKGPSSQRTFDWALANCQVILRGNWDEGIGSQQFENDAFYYQQLGKDRLRRLMEFPLEKHLCLSGRRIRLIHGRPTMGQLLYIHDSAEALQALLAPDFDVLGYADSHRQGLRMLRGIVFNTGSVGNGMGVNMVQYAILTGREDDAAAPFDVTLVTLPYDKEQAVLETQAEPLLPNAHLFIRELRTGIYSRPGGTPGK